MSSVILTIAGGMFGIPLAVDAVHIRIGNGDTMSVGEWSMALGVIVGGIGTVVDLSKR